MSLKRFMSEVHRVCKYHNIVVDLVPAEQVYMRGDADPVAGYFDDEAKIVVVAFRRADWVDVLAHEFGHVQQYIEKLYVNEQLWTIWRSWLHGAEYPKKIIDKALQEVAGCELDAERRAVGLLSQYGLCPDIPKYVAEAHAYVLSYVWARKHRAMPNQRRPVNWSNVLPTTFVSDVSELKLTRDLDVLFKVASS